MYFTSTASYLTAYNGTQDAFYLDPVEGAVHVSHDEGKTWAKADIPSEASMIIEHPFDNHYVRNRAAL